MSLEKQLDEIRSRVAKMTKQDALDWQGAFIGALCNALDNPAKWKICLMAADNAFLTMKPMGISSVKTKE